MDFLNKLKTNIERHANLWIILWILILINALVLLSLAGFFSWLLLLAFTVLALAGIGILLAIQQVNLTEAIPQTVKDNVNDLMQEIKPICEDIFNRETKKLTEPIIEDRRADFHKGLDWLWEDSDEFLTEVEAVIRETSSVSSLINTLSEEKHKLMTKLQDNIDFLRLTIEEIKVKRQKDYSDLDRCLDDKGQELLKSMENEKQIFYDYVYKMLVEQVKNNEEELDVTEYFDVYKLGEQFSLIITKSLEGRMTAFQEAIVNALENFSADVVGQMQKYTMHIKNTCYEIQETLNFLANECQDGGKLLLKRLNDAAQKNTDLQERAGEIMVSLAWQDILLEKRWDEFKEKLYYIKNQVAGSVDEGVIDYVKEVINHEVPGLSRNVRNAEGAVFYKSLLDAELLYQVYKGGKNMELTNNGVYALLYYIRPLEMLLNKSLRLTEEGIKKRKLIKKEVKEGKFQQYFDKVSAVASSHNSDMAVYLQEVFPHWFFSFCNSPYVKPYPDSLNLAAWSVFMLLIEGDNGVPEDIYFLVGLLLVAYKIRNEHIHPLKSTLEAMADESKLELMRFICYKVTDIILNNEIKGIVRINYKYR